MDGISDDLRRERDDLRELSLPQLARHGTEDARADGILVGLDEHHRIPVEADVGAVPAPHFLDRAHDDRPRHLALLHGAIGRGFLDGDDDRVAERGVALVGATHDPDALHLLGAGVVGHVEHRAGLDHDLGHAAEDLADPPALLLRHGPRLLDQHAVPHLRLVALVVRLQLLADADDALVLRMAIDALDPHHARLLHGLVHHHALSTLPLGHARLSYFRRSRSTVFARARSFRAWLRREGFLA